MSACPRVKLKGANHSCQELFIPFSWFIACPESQTWGRCPSQPGSVWPHPSLGGHCGGFLPDRLSHIHSLLFCGVRLSFLPQNISWLCTSLYIQSLAHHCLWFQGFCICLQDLNSSHFNSLTTVCQCWQYFYLWKRQQSSLHENTDAHQPSRLGLSPKARDRKHLLAVAHFGQILLWKHCFNII